MALSTEKTRLALLKEGLYSGIGWSLGVTVGFAIISTLILFAVNNLGGIPVIGGIIANIVESTTTELTVHSPESPLRPTTKKPTPTLTVTPEMLQ